MCVLKMKFLALAVQKLSSEQTYRHTDTQIWLKVLPTTYLDGKKGFLSIYPILTDALTFRLDTDCLKTSIMKSVIFQQFFSRFK